MHHLGVPTTRAGCVITSDTYAVRDLRYDGNPKRERATIVLRIAPTFLRHAPNADDNPNPNPNPIETLTLLRFGSFQIVLPADATTGRPGPSTGRGDILKQLLDYTIKYHVRLHSLRAAVLTA